MYVSLYFKLKCINTKYFGKSVSAKDTYSRVPAFKFKKNVFTLYGYLYLGT